MIPCLSLSKKLTLIAKDWLIPGIYLNVIWLEKLVSLHSIKNKTMYIYQLPLKHTNSRVVPRRVRCGVWMSKWMGVLWGLLLPSRLWNDSPVVRGGSKYTKGAPYIMCLRSVDGKGTASLCNRTKNHIAVTLIFKESVCLKTMFDGHFGCASVSESIFIHDTLL